jgi:hypothetical protein
MADYVGVPNLCRAGLQIHCLLFPEWNDDRIVNDRNHARYYDLHPEYLGSARWFTEALAQHQSCSIAAAYSAL